MTEALTNQCEKEVRAAAARTVELRRKPSTRESNVAGRIKRHPLMWILLVLLIAFPPALLVARPQRSLGKSPVAMTKQAALNSLSDFLGDSIYPAKINQAKGLDQKGFSAWLNQTKLSRSVKSGIRERLQPVLSAARFEAVLLSGVKLKSSDRTTDVALVGVIPDLQQKLGTDVFVIYGEPSGGAGSGGNDQIDVCQYLDCYCANPNNCSCTSTTSFTKNCPPNECSTAGGSCGGSSGGGGGGGGILETLSAF